MHLSRIKISNFRNFSDLDVALAGNIVVVGENRVGKSSTGDSRICWWSNWRHVTSPITLLSGSIKIIRSGSPNR